MEELSVRRSNARARPRLGPSARQALFFHYSAQTQDEKRRRSPYNDAHKTLQFLLVSRAYFHVFFGRQLAVVCQKSLRT
ncbi:hypothetical protein M3Y99_00922300 [Aphelenchoides fujianensis]|nr:hypothetical protein M3Y99_00922300 [Aphelenchoides fujianensis]